MVELKKDIGEIWVEETIEDGVGAAGGDSDQVADEVSQHHGLCKGGRKCFIGEWYKKSCVIISVLCGQLKLEIQWGIDQKLALFIPEVYAQRISSDCLKICVSYFNVLLKYSIITFS